MPLILNQEDKNLPLQHGRFFLFVIGRRRRAIGEVYEPKLSDGNRRRSHRSGL